MNSVLNAPGGENESDTMTYSNIVRCYDGPAHLEGRTIAAFHTEYSYAALRLDQGEVINFAVEEVTVGKWFEVFPVCLHDVGQEDAFAWRELEQPFTVTSTELLWREEWLEPSTQHADFMGSGPHATQFAATIGTAPRSNGNVVKVLAGIRLTGQDGRQLVIASSDNSPFRIDLVMGLSEIARIMRCHTAETT